MRSGPSQTEQAIWPPLSPDDKWALEPPEPWRYFLGPGFGVGYYVCGMCEALSEEDWDDCQPDRLGD